MEIHHMKTFPQELHKTLPSNPKLPLHRTNKLTVGLSVTGLIVGLSVSPAVGLPVGLSVIHPLVASATLTPALCAEHSFGYVIPSQPHTGELIAWHVSGSGSHVPVDPTHSPGGRRQIVLKPAHTGLDD